MEVAAAHRATTGLLSTRGVQHSASSSAIRRASTPVPQTSRQCCTRSNGLNSLGHMSGLHLERKPSAQRSTRLQGGRRRFSNSRPSSLVRSQLSNGAQSFSVEQHAACSNEAGASGHSHLPSNPGNPPVSPATSADALLAQLPTPLLLLALRFPACRKALRQASPQISRLSGSTLAAASFALWFVSGRYIPSERRVLFALARGYRRHVRNFDGPQLLHELNFLPELPDLGDLFPALTWAVVLSHAVFTSLGSVSFAQWSAAVPGLPEFAPPTIGHRFSESGYIDKSDQPETPGYHPLGEWVGPRGLKPWERNAVTIDQKQRDKFWKKNMDEATLNPFNSTRKERKVLLALAFISSSLTNMWILLHAMFVPLIFIWFMFTIEKPLFWVLGQAYKLRKLVGDYKGPLSK